MTRDSSFFVAPILHRPRNFQWCWNSAADPWINETEWTRYSGIENEIIENAYEQKQFNGEIDGDYVINLEFLLQYEIGNESTVRPVKRIQLNNNCTTHELRKDRFAVPVAIKSSSLASQEIEDTRSNKIFRLLLSMDDLPRAYLLLNPPKSGKTIASVVKDAAKGIVEEGALLSKAHEANWIAQQLLAVKDSGKDLLLCSETEGIPAQIGQTCATLYTMESHFYKRLNDVMRNLSEITMQQVTSIGPFCYLLQAYLEQTKSVPKVIVYRGVDLTNEQRQDGNVSKSRKKISKADITKE